ncbi:MAG: hypothetical protein RI894_1304 [Bacteroidota bacterium]|jgi:hypothetical protein
MIAVTHQFSHVQLELLRLYRANISDDVLLEMRGVLRYRKCETLPTPFSGVGKERVNDNLGRFYEGFWHEARQQEFNALR